MNLSFLAVASSMKFDYYSVCVTDNVMITFAKKNLLEKVEFFRFSLCIRLMVRVWCEVHKGWQEYNQ